MNNSVHDQALALWRAQIRGLIEANRRQHDLFLMNIASCTTAYAGTLQGSPIDQTHTAANQSITEYRDLVARLPKDASDDDLEALLIDAEERLRQLLEQLLPAEVAS